LVAPAARVERLTGEIDNGINPVERRLRKRTTLWIPSVDLGNSKALWFDGRA
jgi:hypothetical protein